tara:strand:- start:3004 stop:6915 length:3912 start_codon:yes stop_codon:yes gene_type:complete
MPSFDLPSPSDILSGDAEAPGAAPDATATNEQLFGGGVAFEKPVVISSRIDPMPKRLGDYLVDNSAVPEGAEANVLAHETSAGAAAFIPGYPTSEPNTDLPRDPTDPVRPTDGLHDLSAASRRSLANYAAENQNAVNRYSPDPKTTQETVGHQRGHALSKVTDDSAFSPSPTKHFDDISGGTAANATLGSFFGAPRLSQIISKDGTVPPAPAAGGPYAGDDVLRKGIQHSDSTGQLVTTNLTEAIKGVLDDSNRFSPNPDSSPYIKNANTENELEAYSKGLWSVQTGTGILGQYDKDAPKVTIEDLRAMALQTMISAGGHENLADANMLNFGAIADMAALIPSLTQIGAGTIATSVLRIKNSPTAEFGGNTLAQGGDAAFSAAVDALGLPEDAQPSLGASRLFNSMGADDIIMVQSKGELFGVGAGGLIEGLSAPRNASSYGQMNSFIEPFDGALPMGMFLISLYGLLATALIGGIMEGALAAGEGADDPTTSKQSEHQRTAQAPGTLSMGRRVPKSSSLAQMFLELFGIYRTDGNWAACVIRGTMAFYGIQGPIKDLTLEKAIGVALNLALAPGYYASITKQVLRDVEQITEAAVGFGNAMGVTGFITQIFKLIESLFSSTTFRFINTLAQMGDKVYQDLYAWGEYGHLGADVVKYKDQVNKNVLNPTTRRNSMTRFQIGNEWVGKYNLYTYGSILMPNQLNDKQIPGMKSYSGLITGQDEDVRKWLMKEFSGEGGTFGSAGAWSKWISKPLAKPKIEASTVKIVEEALDKEYIPFYIHDLRTNEIIAMPAFIMSIGDSFSSDYSETHGYGRTDAVRVYTKTTRSIDVTFKLAAMSKKDHSYMWYVINRLVAMLYPQRSKGRARVFENNTKSFIQPFSQVPTASPMVRLRLGNLLASNYSTKNLGRLFGYPDNFDMVMTEEDYERVKRNELKRVAEKDKNPFISKIHEEFINFLKKGDEVSSEALTKEKYNTIRLKKGALVKFLTVGGYDKARDPGKRFGPKPVLSDFINVTLDGVSNTYSVEEGKDGELSTTYKGSKLDISINMADNPVPGMPKKPVTSAFGKRVSKAFRCYGANQKKLTALATVDLVDTSLIAISAKEEDSKLKKMIEAAVQKEGEKGTKVDKIKDENKTEYEKFMKADKNAFVRSFESARGKGLAGHITQMSLNYEGSQWEIDEGSQAPQMVEIQMSFAPIHDLPLGLDHDGNMIAPSHPVGLAYTNPYASAKGAPPEDTAMPPGSEVGAAFENADTEGPEPPPDKAEGEGGDGPPDGMPSPPGMSLGGFDPMKLTSLVGGLDKLKGLF